MQGKRTERVASLLQMELSNLILERVKDPRLGFVTVTHVKITPDLKSAVVFVSIMGEKKKKEESLKVLERAAGFLQHEVGLAIKMRYTPRLQFELDDSLDKDFEIGQVIRKIEEKDNPPASKDPEADGANPHD
jgi:ribosome-binding factor A